MYSQPKFTIKTNISLIEVVSNQRFLPVSVDKSSRKLRGAVKNVLADFFPLRGYPSPTPLTENHFAKKPLAERGGSPPPLNGKSQKKILQKWVKKG